MRLVTGDLFDTGECFRNVCNVCSSIMHWRNSFCLRANRRQILAFFKSLHALIAKTASLSSFLRPIAVQNPCSSANRRTCNRAIFMYKRQLTAKFRLSFHFAVHHLLLFYFVGEVGEMGEKEANSELS